MNPQAESRFRAAREKLAAAPDDLASLRQFAEAARGFDRRDDALDAMKAAYQRRPTPELYAELRSICTYPEFLAIAKPPENPDAPARQVATGAELLPRKAFPLLLDQVIFYPVQDGLSVFILVTCTLLMALGHLFGFAMGGLAFAGAVICLGIVFGYLWSVMHASGMGEKQTRGWPDITQPEEFGSAIVQYMMVWLICFGPALLLLFWGSFSDEGPSMVNVLGALALAGIGVAYFPMALMLSGFTQNFWEAFNFPSAVRSIGRMPLDYFICLGFFIITWVIVFVIEGFIRFHLIGDAPFLMKIALAIFLQGINVYLLIVQMRTVGLLYYAREKDLGWFQ